MTVICWTISSSGVVSQNFTVVRVWFLRSDIMTSVVWNAFPALVFPFWGDTCVWRQGDFVSRWKFQNQTNDAGNKGGNIQVVSILHKTSYHMILWKCRVCEIGNSNYCIAFNGHIGSCVAEVPVEFQRDGTMLNKNHAALRDLMIRRLFGYRNGHVTPDSSKTFWSQLRGN